MIGNSMKLIYTSQYGTITEERARDLGLLVTEDSPMQTLSTANIPEIQDEERDPHIWSQCTCVPDCACRVADDVNVPCDCGCEACTEQNKDDFRGWDLGTKDFDRDELDEEKQEKDTYWTPYDFDEEEKDCTCDPSCSRYDDTRRPCNCGCEKCDNLVDEEIEGAQDAFIDSPVSVVAEEDNHWVYDVRRPGLIKHTLCEASMRIGDPCSVCGLYEGETLKKASAQDLKKEILAIIKEEMTEWPRARQADESAVPELLQYTENDGEIYERRVVPILKNLKRKAAKGIYDPKLAAKLWTYAADDAARKYEKEFGMPVGSLSVATRKLVGIELEKRNRDEIMKGTKTSLEEEKTADEEVCQRCGFPEEGNMRCMCRPEMSSLNKKKKAGLKKEASPKLEEQMGSGGGRSAGRFGPLGLALDPEAESDIDDDLRSLDEPTEWELASMGLGSKKDKKKDLMRFSPLEDEYEDNGGINEEYQPGEQISFKSIASKPSQKREDPKAPKPGDTISMKSLVREEDDDVCMTSPGGLEETGSEYWKDPEYVAEQVAEATSLVTNDDPNMVHRMYGVVRETAEDLNNVEDEAEKEEVLKDLAEYFISMMTDESDNYQQVALEPDNEETGRSALEGAGMFRTEAYTFRKMDQVELGKAIIKHFER